MRHALRALPWGLELLLDVLVHLFVDAAGEALHADGELQQRDGKP
jgi:hypothetical protein